MTESELIAYWNARRDLIKAAMMKAAAVKGRKFNDTGLETSVSAFIESMCFARIESVEEAKILSVLI